MWAPQVRFIFNLWPTRRRRAHATYCHPHAPRPPRLPRGCTRLGAQGATRHARVGGLLQPLQPPQLIDTAALSGATARNRHCCPALAGLRALHNAFAAYAVLDSGVVRPACALASHTPPHPSSTSELALELRGRAGDGGRRRRSFAAPASSLPTARRAALQHRPTRRPPAPPDAQPAVLPPLRLPCKLNTQAQSPLQLWSPSQAHRNGYTLPAPPCPSLPSPQPAAAHVEIAPDSATTPSSVPAHLELNRTHRCPPWAARTNALVCTRFIAPAMTEET